MSIFSHYVEALSQEKIVQQLRELRQNALIDSSHFAVAAIIEIKDEHGHFAYVCGVNVENSEHNRLSLHAEQNAIAAAQSLFGDNFTVSRAWIMGAPDDVIVGSQHPLANNFIKPCGHCRQILLGFSTPETHIYSVAVNGRIEEPKRLDTLLPDAFETNDLHHDAHSCKKNMGRLNTNIPNLPSLGQELNSGQIRAAFRSMMPRMVDTRFSTSDTQACIIKVIDKKGFCQYVQGALVQDIAFLTTDAIFSGIGLAVTRLGGQFAIKEIHLYGQNKPPFRLSGSELEHLARFATAETILMYHTPETSSNAFSLKQCIADFATRLIDKLP